MKIPTIHGVLLSLLLAGAPGALRAEAPDAFDQATVTKPVTWGFQAYLTKPTLDLGTLMPRAGLGGGLFMEQHLTKTAIIQSRLDYVDYRRREDMATPNSFNLLPANVASLAANAASLGVDLRQYLPYPGLESCYVLGGLEAIRYEFQSVSPVVALDQDGLPLSAAPLETKTKTSMKCGGAVGLGYELGHGCALTLRYTYVPIDGSALAALAYGLRVSF